jgi:AcrR family transcriptional regulator
MAETRSEPGRAAQRRRTRGAIVAAATELLARGRTPTVAEVADAAEVSRRTVYMYFPTLEQLLVDAALGSVARETVDATLEAAESDDDAEARVEAMARAVQRLSASTEQQGRTLLRLTADAGRAAQAPPYPPRGYRRVEWIERALAPLRERLTARRFERLVSALSMVVGWEALIVERDVRGLSVDEAEDVSAWAARALVRAALPEARAATPRRTATTAARRTARRK